MEKYKKLILKILISSALIYFLFSRIDIGAVGEKFSLLNLSYVPLIILFLVLNYVVSSVRWKYLLIFENTQKATVKYLTYLYFTGSFFNNFMPTSIGGDVYKILRLGKRPRGKRVLQR